VPAEAIAEACVPVVKSATRPVLSCWMGAASVEDARRRFTQAGIASYHTPEEAVRAFVHSVTYRRNRSSCCNRRRVRPTSTPPTSAAPAACCAPR